VSKLDYFVNPAICNFSKISCKRNHFCRVNNLPTKVFNEWWYVNCLFFVRAHDVKFILELFLLHNNQMHFLYISFISQSSPQYILFSTANFIFLIIPLFFKAKFDYSTKTKELRVDSLFFDWMHVCFQLWFFLLLGHKKKVVSPIFTIHVFYTRLYKAKI